MLGKVILRTFNPKVIGESLKKNDEFLNFDHLLDFDIVIFDNVFDEVIFSKVIFNEVIEF
jgi:hypothetical protein